MRSDACGELPHLTIQPQDEPEGGGKRDPPQHLVEGDHRLAEQRVQGTVLLPYLDPNRLHALLNLNLDDPRLRLGFDDTQVAAALRVLTLFMRPAREHHGSAGH